MSNKHIDETRRLLLNAAEIKIIVEACAVRIDECFKNEDLLMVCIEKGGLYFFADLTRAMKTDHVCDFIKASSYRGQKQELNISIKSEIVASDFEGKTVILVDDIWDTGHTMQAIIEALHERANVPREKIYTCVAFHKIRPDVTTKPDFAAFTIPNVWVYGYGLNNGYGKQRNLNELHAVPKQENIPIGPDDNIFSDPEAYKATRDKNMHQVMELIME